MMRHAYEVNFKALCPNDHNIVDNYVLRVTLTIEDPMVDNKIMVEELISFTESFEKTPIYQEDLLGKMVNKYPGCEIYLSGYHLGVLIESEYAEEQK